MVKFDQIWPNWSDLARSGQKWLGQGLDTRGFGPDLARSGSGWPDLVKRAKFGHFWSNLVISGLTWSNLVRSGPQVRCRSEADSPFGGGRTGPRRTSRRYAALVVRRAP